MTTIFAKPVIASLMLVVAGPPFPHIDIRRICTDFNGADGIQKCMNNEVYAETKLKKHWNKIPLAYKTQCLLDPPPPDPSYTVLRDCINNNEILRKSQGQ